MTPRRAGFTLLELSMVLAGMAIVMLISIAMVFGAFQIEQAANRSVGQLTSRSQLADEFRADVNAALDAPESWKNVRANVGCVVLRLPGDTLLVYRWRNGRVTRQKSAARGTPQREVAFDPACSTVEFVRAGPESRLITMRLVTPLRLGGGKRTTDITATLGGDQR